MSKAEGPSLAGDSTLDRFSHYGYAPSRTVGSRMTNGTGVPISNGTGNGQVFSITNGVGVVAARPVIAGVGVPVVGTAMPPGYLGPRGEERTTLTSASSLNEYRRPPNSSGYGSASSRTARVGLPAVDSDDM